MRGKAGEESAAVRGCAEMIGGGETIWSESPKKPSSAAGTNLQLCKPCKVAESPIASLMHRAIMLQGF
jgi:hypothetical protein